MIDWISMGKFFANLRDKKEYTQHEVATFVEVSDRTIQSFEKGKKKTDFITIMNLCDLYEVEVSMLETFYKRSNHMIYQLMIYKNSDKYKLKHAESIE